MDGIEVAFAKKALLILRDEVMSNLCAKYIRILKNSQEYLYDNS